MSIGQTSVASTPAAVRGVKLSIRHVGRRFKVARQVFTALEDVSLDVREGEFVSIVGTSGCGKSTLLRLVVGLDREFDGEILYDGQPVRGPGLERAIVFQEHRLLPWLTAEQNVALGLLRSTLGKAEQQAAIRKQFEIVGLSSFAQAYPGQLSGGMSQRVAIARALVNQPGLLLLDEPLGALDALTRSNLQAELRRIVREEHVTALLVTHDVEEAVYLGNRVVIMQPGPGHIAEIVDVPEAARNDRQGAAFRHLHDYILARLHGRQQAEGKAGIAQEAPGLLAPALEVSAQQAVPA